MLNYQRVPKLKHVETALAGAGLGVHGYGENRWWLTHPPKLVYFRWPIPSIPTEKPHIANCFSIVCTLRINNRSFTILYIYYISIKVLAPNSVMLHFKQASGASKSRAEAAWRLAYHGLSLWYLHRDRSPESIHRQAEGWSIHIFVNRVQYLPPAFPTQDLSPFWDKPGT